MCFKRKKTLGCKPHLDDGQFATVIELQAREISHKYPVEADQTKYTLLYRDGQFLGMPRPGGGPIYPFSKDPTRQGSRGYMKNFTNATIVVISKDSRLQVFWGTPEQFIIPDPTTGQSYHIGARGVFFLYVDPSNAAQNANMFYRRCLSQGDSSHYDAERLRSFLSDAFSNPIGRELDKFLKADGRPFSAYQGLTPSECGDLSEALCSRVGDIFAHVGLTLDVELSRYTLLKGIKVDAIVSN